MKPTDQTGPGNVLVSEEELSFELLLDDICRRLHETRTHFSLKRIQKLEDTLDSLERELEGILGVWGRAAIPGGPEGAMVPEQAGIPGEE
ncbi:MAG: hypothetical protein LBO65_07985 [Spirochaetaceae bacterium]|nr:hypothetical protein [Spirochaetaceae bacterium]